MGHVMVSIASINEKNKIKNKKMMARAREKERRKRLANKGKKVEHDPFTRAITAPKIESFNALPMDEDDEADKKAKVSEIKQVKRKSKHEEHMEALQQLSILEEHEKRKRIKNESSLDNELFGDNGDGDDDDEKGLLIRNDALWNTAIHSVASEFVDKCRLLDVDMMSGNGGGVNGLMRQPQFGRNTNMSSYAHEFMLKPKGMQIISIDEYLKTKKYSAM